MKSGRPQVLLITRSIVLNQEGQILLIRRSDKDTYNPGLWELPGGKLDEGQDISNALEREVFEETGLLVIPKDRLAYFESVVLTSGKYKGLPYLTIIGISTSKSKKVRLSEEHSEYKWCSVDEAYELETADSTLKAIQTLEDKL
jgi:8-oxo-dGTP pyrophosphatase MutT (NUDIX family)